jgi:drug/metabolite transporter (DMT)-like permease
MSGKVIRQNAHYRTVNRRTIRYAIMGCIVALAAAVVYAIVRLFVLAQRVDASILVVNVILFAGIAGLLIYLTKKDRDIEEEELFRD